MSSVAVLGQGCTSAFLAPDPPRLAQVEPATPPSPPHVLKPDVFVQEGMASWYGKAFHGRRTASGTAFDQNGMTAAHPSLPFGTRLRVTNLSNRRSTIVIINDRGPFVGDRIIDLSYGAAKELGFTGDGIARVRLESVGE